LPNIRKTLLIQVSISFGIALSAEAGLSFLGMAGSDTITLGTILSEGIKYLRLSPALALIPGLIITLLIWTTAKLADTHPSNQT
jgi:peptide/nickel transport system permease protein